MSVLYGWAKTGLKIANKLWEGFCFENWGLGKVCLSHNSSLDCISREIITDPPFLHRRDNNDCRPLHGTWRTLCMNKHLINKAVGRTQKTSFPLSSISKASLCFDFTTNPSSCASKSKQSSHFTAKALGIYSSRTVRNILNGLLETLLDSLLTAYIVI